MAPAASAPVADEPPPQPSAPSAALPTAHPMPAVASSPAVALVEAPAWLADDDQDATEDTVDAPSSDDDSDDDGLLGGVDVLAAWAAQAHVAKRPTRRAKDHGGGGGAEERVPASSTAAPSCTAEQPTSTAPPIEAPCPTPDAHAVVCLASLTQSTPTADPLPFPLAGAQPRSKAPEPPRYWCAACQVACTSLVDWQQHQQVGRVGSHEYLKWRIDVRGSITLPGTSSPQSSRRHACITVACCTVACVTIAGSWRPLLCRSRGFLRALLHPDHYTRAQRDGDWVAGQADHVAAAHPGARPAQRKGQAAIRCWLAVRLI